jgi:PGF-CTERM protein
VRTGNVRIVNVSVDDPDQGVNSTVGQYIPPRVDIVDVDTSGFPTINATLDVNTTEGKAGNLGLDNFNLSEDGSERTIQDLRFDSTNETYVIEYVTADPNDNGTNREISVTASLPSGGTIVVTETYQAPGTPANALPIPSFTVSPSTPDTGETVTFNASNSTDPDGTIVEYRWDLNGDGTYEKNTTNHTVTTSYSNAANINVELQVVDDGGATNTTNRVVSVGGAETVSDGQPGFGVVIAVVALIAAVLFARRRE